MPAGREPTFQEHRAVKEKPVMSYEFVTSGNRRHDEETRRRIRTQVMRDFRRRQSSQRATSGVTEDSSDDNPPSTTARSGPSRSASRRTQSRRPASFSRSPSRHAQLPRTEVQRMHDTWQEYRDWLRAGQPGLSDTDQSIMDAAWRAPTTQMRLHALYLEASAYFGIVDTQREQHDADFQARIKIGLLEQTITRLHDPRMAIETETIAALASLTSYEILRSSGEASIHLKGISEILTLRRREPDGHDPQHLYHFLETLDLIHAIASNTETFFTTELSDSPNTIQTAIQTHNSSFLPAHTSPFIPQADYMEEWWDSSETEQAPALISPTSMHDWQRVLTQTRAAFASTQTERSSVSAAESTADTSPAAFTAVGSAPEGIQQYTQWQHDDMKSATGSADTKDTLLQLQTLLTALAKSSNSPGERSWYVAQAIRLVQHIKIRDWPRTKRMMLDFVTGMQTVQPGPSGASLTRLARVNDIEVVLNPTAGA